MTATTVLAPDAYHEIRHGLYDATLGYSGSDWGRDVMSPWVAAHPQILADLQNVGRPAMASVVLADTDRWALYAASRLVDALILPLQPASGDSDHHDDWIPVTAYEQFVTTVGGTFPASSTFHPFLHEIVAVDPADDPHTPPEIAGRWWPGCLIGSLLLLLMRAGVTVRAGADHLDPVVATSSALYWASRRRCRPARDLSQGWGGNSMWQTRFRRDYALPDRLLYNVDATLDPVPEHPGGMPYNTDVTLLRNRCSTLTDHGDDEWLWENHYTEPAPAQWL